MVWTLFSSYLLYVWIAGLIAAVSFGSFGVPIKATKARIKVDPLVMQSYKSVICFLTCWLVIPMGVPFSFTPWGIGKMILIRGFEIVIQGYPFLSIR